MKRIHPNRLTQTALLAAIALGVWYLESLLPPFTAVPGVKPGLANCLTLYALYTLGRKEAAGVLTVRVLLAAVLAGGMGSFLYSAAGGLLCLLVMLCVKLPPQQMWVTSVFGAIAHNAGQLTVAALLMRTAVVFVYLPHLLIAAILAGTLTGLTAQFAYFRLHKYTKEG
ncbi:MAG: Gx transporter family protein [Eubacteriales bacterium]|jgi:heptaprenyl diphosphate synthase